MRGGFTVLEALVALLVGWLLAALTLGTLVRQLEVQRALALRGEVLAALRTTRHVLDGELRGGDGSEAVAADSLALRAFRGMGLPCPERDAGSRILVWVRGGRAPDPEKDSVLLTFEEGPPRVLALFAREAGAGACTAPPGETVERWTLSGSVPAGVVLARYFERGGYHLRDGALRYRRGDAGRQPLTPEVLATPPSGFSVSPHGVEVELRRAHAPDGTGRILLVPRSR